MEKGVSEQHRKIKDVVLRAKGNPDAAGPQRRNALRQLIDLTHFRHSSLKILAAGEIRHFFKDFPDLEEEAINAIYDLCEDQDSQVRMAGYTAITYVSKDRPDWVKRNADVLVQLLQSDEPEEVTIVKKALIEHLDMDCCVTLGVLCDQVVPVDESADEEEQLLRRSLVLSFISTEANRAIVDRHAKPPTSKAEEILLNALTAVLPKLGKKDLEIVVKGLLVSLPSYKNPHSSRGNDLLQLLLGQASISLRTSLRQEDCSSFTDTRFYLDLAKFIVVDKDIAPCVDLLTFYCTSLLGKMTLARLSPDDAVSVISDTTHILTICEARNELRPTTQLPLLRRQVVDACPILLEYLLDSKRSRMRSWQACKALLRACLQRKKESNWAVPVPLTNILVKIRALAESSSEMQDSQSVQSLTRSLIEPSPQPALRVPIQAAYTLPNPPGSHQTADITGKLQGRRPSIPERRSCVGQITQAIEPRRFLDRGDTKAKPIIIDIPPPTMPVKRPTTIDSGQPHAKKIKQHDGGKTDSKPSLLSRMGNSTSNGVRSSIDENPSSQRRESTLAIHRAGPEHEKQNGAGGFSILGAGRVKSMESRQLSAASLLERMRGLSSSDDDLTRNQKKRGKINR